MKFKGTWILLAALAALVAYFYGVEEPRQEARRQAEDRSALLLPGFEADRVTEVSLEGTGGVLRLAKAEDGAWSVLEPWNDRADIGRVRSLLAALGELKASREVAGADADLGPFGLEEPEVAVATRGAEARVAVGGLNPAGDFRYVRAGEGPVHLVPGHGLAALLGDPADFRSKDVLGDFPWSALAGLEVRTPGGEALRLTRAGEDWTIEAPLSAAADPEAVGRLTEKLRWARVAGFLDEDPGVVDQRLADGTTVTVRGAGGEEATLRLAEVDGSVWAARVGRDAWFTVAEDVLDTVQVPAEALRRRKPLLLRGWKAERLELRLADPIAEKSLTYGKEDGLWAREGAQVTGDELAALQDYLWVLETAAAAEILDSTAADAEHGLDEPVLTARVEEADGVVQGFALGLRDDALFARSREGGPVYRMPEEYLDKAQALFATARPGGEPAPQTE